MQNDVVRWPAAGKCNKTIKGHHQKCLNKIEKTQKTGLHGKHDAYTIAATSQTTTTTTTPPPFPRNSENPSQHSLLSRCDTATDYYDIYLVHNVVRRSKNRQSYLCGQTKDENSCCNRRRRTSTPLRSRSHCRIELWNCLTLLLHVSTVVFVCSLNVGFVVASAANVVNSNNNSESSYIEVNKLPYELDYGLDGVNRTTGHYTHTWAVHVPDGEKDGKADLVALDHGFINLGRIFDDHYHFAHHRVAKRSLSPASKHQARLDEDDRVHWAQQQVAKSRRKRDYIRMRPSRISRTSSRSTFSLADTVPFDDPKWPHMWYLNRGGDLDMNVIPAWKDGITGKGIVVTILDDGLESDHPDIISNFDPDASYDVNSHDSNPMPHYDLTDSNRHGTRCAGEVAATANNSICAVGIAFGASVGGVRMLDGDVTDAVEARSLSLNPQHIDIYSASWGPDDDGKTVDGPGELASRAFIEGVTKGRAGKGSIFIWASGNGGRELDNCNCDGYTNSIWTLSISSATEEGYVPWYSEKCSSTLATTYSSGSQTEKQVVTTDLHHSCTVSHTGTSASAPLAAGIAALVLESNKNLTWRDMQHIVVRTAKPANLIDATWSKNGVGRRVSHSFGYGLMDASAMVKVARNWKTVPEQQRCEINAPHVDKVIPPKSHITLQLSVKNCLNINFLEHVQAKITLTSQRRGDIQLNLISPAGTKVTLLTPRVHDTSHSGFNQWPFMSVHTWGESPHGNWQLEIHNEGRYMAQITQWDLIFYGTETPVQPDDPVQANSKTPFGVDIEHNDVEYDSNRQWGEMRQIDKSSITSNDRTNTSCLKATINNQCLVCAPPTVFYRGHCYSHCPAYTYATKHTSKLLPPQLDEVTVNTNMITPTNDDDDELVSLDRRKRTHAIGAKTFMTCQSCDPSCRRCEGPLSSQCLACSVGSQLRSLPHSNETYCINYSERSSGNAGNASPSSHSLASYNYRTIILMIFFIPSVIVATLFILLRKYDAAIWGLCRNRPAGHESATNYTYDRVALIAGDGDDVDDEEDEEEEEEQEEVNVEVLGNENVDGENNVAITGITIPTPYKSNVCIYVDEN